MTVRLGYALALLTLVGCSKDEDKRETDAAMMAADVPDASEVPLDSSRPRIDARVTPPRDGSRVDAEVCNQAQLTFDPRPPTTYLLVDRSSSMFENGLWEPLKVGVLAIVQQLSGEVRFGFADYTGKNGGTCPDSTKVTIAEDNYAAIAAAYNALAAPSYKGETPTALALAEAASTLAADPGTGPKSIVLVTDGEPDFCDDANVTCARDAVVAAAQGAFAREISTFILSIGGQVDRTHLRDVANAGTGAPVLDHNGAVASQCKPPRATYASSEGAAPYFEPDVANQAALVNTLANVVARTRSCVFDLTGQVKIDVAQAAEGTVVIDGTRVEYGGTNGFRMNNASELELLGSACELVRSPRQVTIDVDFPCQAIIFI